MARRHSLTAARLLFAALSLTALGRQLVIHVESGFKVVNFFSYFTNLSNLFAALVLLRFAALSIGRRQPSKKEELLRGMAVAYMVIVGVVFAILLRNADLGALRPWVNVVLHYVMPVVLVVDWLVQPGPALTGARSSIPGLIFPLVYLSYVLTRGGIIGWYPYPFLDPRTAGYTSVAVHAILIMLLFLLTQWAVNATTARRGLR